MPSLFSQFCDFLKHKNKMVVSIILNFFLLSRTSFKPRVKHKLKKTALCLTTQTKKNLYRRSDLQSFILIINSCQKVFGFKSFLNINKCRHHTFIQVFSKNNFGAFNKTITYQASRTRKCDCCFWFHKQLCAL